MKITAVTGRDDIATVYLAEMGGEKIVEFLESVQPPLPREKKWVVIVSTLFGCPVRCPMCDAGGNYRGKLSKEEIFAQIDFLVEKRFPSKSIPVDKFKVQFARMGEPSFNPAVLEVLQELPHRYQAPGLLPCLSTVAPVGTERFFERLLEIKQNLYPLDFQLQFSLHSTDDLHRRRLIPTRVWDFATLAAYGERFFRHGGRKITLNFALPKEVPLEAEVLSRYFDPNVFLVKITPLNPTYRAAENGLTSYILPEDGEKEYETVTALREVGYDVIVSIGEIAENYIGSNCGQYVLHHLQSPEPLPDGYTDEVRFT